jgi:hypothetical protein
MSLAPSLPDGPAGFEPDLLKRGRRLGNAGNRHASMTETQPAPALASRAGKLILNHIDGAWQFYCHITLINAENFVKI